MASVYEVSAKCPICGMWYNTKSTLGGSLQRNSCIPCRKQYYSMATKGKNVKKKDTVQINGCTLERTATPKRCKGWTDGNCTEEKYLACLDYTADKQWEGWITV